ncbi:MAG TPA: hypothetical protein VMS17_07175 [Gemmataceae bacterium]|nr:hypothetical protein [Gemmataceae bacterium]
MRKRIPNLSGEDLGPALMAPDVVEVPLLLPGWQVAALADAAQDRGLTAGEMLRHLLSNFIQDQAQRRSSPLP